MVTIRIEDLVVLRFSSMVDFAHFGVLWPVSYRPAMSRAQELQDTRDIGKGLVPGGSLNVTFYWHSGARAQRPEVEPHTMTRQTPPLSKGWEHSENWPAQHRASLCQAIWTRVCR